jgi:3-deoxy-D-manno-octulosonic-acid transferase
VNPSLVVLAESELWPNFLHAAARQRVPVVVVNGRVSPRTFARMKRVAGAVRRMLFRHVAAFGVQTPEYADRLCQLGVTPGKVAVTGSVKYDGATGDRESSKAVELRRLLSLDDPGERWRVWVAGSTHAPEESIVLDVFARLRGRFPALRLVLVPRHPDRFAEVAALVEKSGLPFARRSRVTEPLPEIPAVVLLDTVGELGAAWALADIGFTGGSLDGKRGGQSMIEPAGYGVPVVFGPHVWNFRDAARLLVEAGGAIMVRDAAGLERELDALLGDPDRRTEMGEIARKLVRAQQGATARTLDLLDRVIDGGR